MRFTHVESNSIIMFYSLIFLHFISISSNLSYLKKWLSFQRYINHRYIKISNAQNSENCFETFCNCVRCGCVVATTFLYSKDVAKNKLVHLYLPFNFLMKLQMLTIFFRKKK